ncbi:MAG: BrnA antitoxin family protein [Zetaproteobacteria bacterium]|nr:BrnA antitoxin family protein [Zetaproteobacteria bacterium]
MLAKNKDLSTTEEEALINQGIADDPDTFELDESFFACAVKAGTADTQSIVHAVRGKQRTPVKQQVTLRLPENVIDYFKKGGKGWQTRLSHTLEEYVKNHR